MQLGKFHAVESAGFGERLGAFPVEAGRWTRINAKMQKRFDQVAEVLLERWTNGVDEKQPPLAEEHGQGNPFSSRFLNALGSWFQNRINLCSRCGQQTPIPSVAIFETGTQRVADVPLSGLH